MYHTVDHPLLQCVLPKSLPFSSLSKSHLSPYVSHQRSHDLERSAALSVPVTTFPFVASSFIVLFGVHSTQSAFSQRFTDISLFSHNYADNVRPVKKMHHVMLYPGFSSYSLLCTMTFSSYGPSACPVHCSLLSLFKLMCISNGAHHRLMVLFRHQISKPICFRPPPSFSGTAENCGALISSLALICNQKMTVILRGLLISRLFVLAYEHVRHT